MYHREINKQQAAYRAQGGGGAPLTSLSLARQPLPVAYIAIGIKPGGSVSPNIMFIIATNHMLGARERSLSYRVRMYGEDASVSAVILAWAARRRSFVSSCCGVGNICTHRAARDGVLPLALLGVPCQRCRRFRKFMNALTSRVALKHVGAWRKRQRIFCLRRAAMIVTAFSNLPVSS